MSDLRTIRSFALEMMKIAADISDADIRKLLSERKGQEYLAGGRLLANTEQEALYFPKMSSTYPNSMALASDSYNLSSRKKKNNTYQKLRDYSTTGFKGALTGLGVLGASNAMRGHFKSPAAGLESVRAAKNARRAATIGASTTVLDRAYRHDELNREKTAFINSNPTTSFRSPAESLAETNRTGSFESKIHNVGTPLKTVQIGRKFRIP